MVFILGVEVEWYLFASIFIYTIVLIPISYKAEIMPISLDEHISNNIK